MTVSVDVNILHTCSVLLSDAQRDEARYFKWTHEYYFILLCYQIAKTKNHRHIRAMVQ